MHDAESSIDWPQVAVHGNPPTGRWVSCCGPVRCWRYGEYACPAPCIRALAKCIWGSICSPWPTRRRGAAFDCSVLCGSGLGRDAAHPPQAAPHRGQARPHTGDAIHAPSGTSLKKIAACACCTRISDVFDTETVLYQAQAAPDNVVSACARTPCRRPVYQVKMA